MWCAYVWVCVCIIQYIYNTLHVYDGYDDIIKSINPRFHISIVITETMVYQ